LFELGCTPAQRQVLENAFGSLEAAAEAVDILNHGGIAAMSVTSHQRSRLRNALNTAQQFFGMDLQGLKTHVDQMLQQTQQSTPSFSVEQTLEQLRQ